MAGQFGGHASLAEMVSTHIGVWRTLLTQARAAVPGDFSIGADGCPASPEADQGYFDHELQALADIEEACRAEMEPAPPSFRRG